MLGTNGVPALIELDLRDNPLSDEGLKALVRSSVLEQSAGNSQARLTGDWAMVQHPHSDLCNIIHHCAYRRV